MSDESYQDPEHAIPYLRLIQLGVPTWNKWIKGELTGAEATELGLEQLPERPTDYGKDVNFSGVDFTKGKNGLISFDGAEFGDRASFSDSTFGASADFSGAKFGYFANFSRTEFGDESGGFPNFCNATFGDGVRFIDAEFRAEAYFVEAKFGDEACFIGARFSDGAEFNGATFGKGADFSGRTPSVRRKAMKVRAAKDEVPVDEQKDWVKEKLEDFGQDRLADISFHKARFLGRVQFKDRKFEGFANFSHVCFDQPPIFENCDGMDRLDVTGARFGFTGSRPKYLPKLLWWIAPNWTRNSNIPTRLRILRKQMDDIKAHDAERDLFIAERMAERGVLWDATFKKLFPLKSFMTMQWPVPLLKAIGATGLLFFFWLFSDCARSALRPFMWFIGNIALFYAGYAETIQPGSLGAGLSMLNEQTAWDDVLWRYLCDIGSFTTGHALPFIGSIGPAKQGAIERLFPHGEFEPLAMLPGVEAASILQSLIGALLLFLFLQAVRNHFRLR